MVNPTSTQLRPPPPPPSSSTMVKEEDGDSRYGRGKRSRYSSTSINYRKLAGEDPTYFDSDGNISIDSTTHANKHVHQVLSRSFTDSSTILQTITDGSDLTLKNILDKNHKLTHKLPMLITDTPSSIGMKLPKSQSDNEHISIGEVGELIGMDHPVTVMDVRTQEELDGWNFSDLVDYFTDEDRLYTRKRRNHKDDTNNNNKYINNTNINNNPYSSTFADDKHSSSSKPRVLNQISLEFSRTSLSHHVLSPSFVREMDWINHVWPASRKKNGDYPRVHYYCLTSTAGCYTDFHVDFGGTSVYYHVLSGEKVFLLIPPTEMNLSLYEKWLCSKRQSEIFFPDMQSTNSEDQNENQTVGPVIKVTLRANQTMIIPTAWIHAVYTPVDSIVVGGNFLHGLDIKLQLDVHCLETRTRVPKKFRFPSFVPLMFYAAVYYYGRMGGVGEGGGAAAAGGDLVEEEVGELGYLIDALKIWAVQQDGEAGMIVGSVPYTIRECFGMVEEMGTTAKDFGEVLGLLEEELRVIKEGGERKLIKSGLKPIPPSGNTLEKGKMDDIVPKPKLRLKLGKKLSQPKSQTRSSSPGRRKKRIVRDLTSKTDVHTNDDDDEWEPGSRRKQKKPKVTRNNRPRSPREVTASSTMIEGKVVVEEETIVSSCSKQPLPTTTTTNGLVPPLKKKEDKFKERKMTMARKGGGVKSRLKKKFGR